MSVSRSSQDLPFLFVNMAISADGKIASVDQRLSSFGSAQDRHRLLMLRARADAVMAGARTVDSHRINLGPGPLKYRRLRLRNGLSEYNARIVVTGSGSLDPGAEIFRHRFSPIIILTTARIPSKQRRDLESIADCVKVCGRAEIDFTEALRWLKREWKVTRLLCEGGGELNDALFRSQLVHELNLTICPLLLGGRSAPTIADGAGRSLLKEAAGFNLKSILPVHGELFAVYTVCPSGRVSTQRASSQSTSESRFK